MEIRELQELIAEESHKVSDLVDLVISHGDARWSSIARTHFEEGFMALNRAATDELNKPNIGFFRQTK